MNSRLQAPEGLALTGMQNGPSLSVGKALALSFSLAIGVAAIFVAAGVLLSR